METSPLEAALLQFALTQSLPPQKLWGHRGHLGSPETRADEPLVQSSRAGAGGER